MTTRTRVKPTDDEYLTPDQLAQLVNVSPATVKWWRYAGGGPEFVGGGTRGRKVAYPRSAVDRWIESRRRSA